MTHNNPSTAYGDRDTVIGRRARRGACATVGDGEESRQRDSMRAGSGTRQRRPAERRRVVVPPQRRSVCREINDVRALKTSLCPRWGMQLFYKYNDVDKY